MPHRPVYFRYDCIALQGFKMSNISLCLRQLCNLLQGCWCFCLCGTRISGLSSDKPDYPGHWSGLLSTSLGLRECAFSACIYIHLYIYISISIAHPHRVFISTLYVVKPAFWLDLIDNDYCVVVAVFVFAPNHAWHWKKAYRQPGDGLRCVSEFYSTKRLKRR